MFDRILEFKQDGNFVIVIIASGDNKREAYRIPRAVFNTAITEYNENKRG